MATTPLSQIPTLASLYNFGRPDASNCSSRQPPVQKWNEKIGLIRTDITRMEVDAIVNAANNPLLGGGGVDGAVHRAAGEELLDECRSLAGCDTGSAKITKGYRLPASHVIHAVGPVYQAAKVENMHKKLLRSCYTKSLELAIENGCKTIAFAAISTGVYGYPSGEAAEVVLEAVRRWLDQDEERAAKLERIVFCSFMERDETAYEDLAPFVFSACSPCVLRNIADLPVRLFFPPVTENAAEDTKERDSKKSSAAALPDVPGTEPKE